MADQTKSDNAKMTQELKAAFNKARVMLENASEAPVEKGEGVVNNFVQVTEPHPYDLTVVSTPTPDQTTGLTPPQCVTEIIRLLERFKRESQERILRAVVGFYGLTDIDV